MNTAISSGRQMSPNIVDRNDARLKNSAPTKNRHSPCASASTTLNCWPIAGASTGMMSGGIIAMAKHCASPVAVRTPSSCLRVIGSDSVKSAEPFFDSDEQAAAAEQHREQHAHLRQVVAEGVVPDEAAELALYRDGLTNGGAERRVVAGQRLDSASGIIR